MLSPQTLDRLTSIAVFLNTAPGARGGQQQAERLEFGTQLPDVVPAVHEGRQKVRVADAALERAHSLRDRLTTLWTDAFQEKDVTDQINALLQATGPLELLATDEDLIFAPADAPADAVERLQALAALALADTAVEGELSRLRVCAGEDCENMLVDASRNRSKRFCDEANCGNRMHVRSYRARQVGEEEAAQTATKSAPSQPARAEAPSDAPRSGQSDTASPDSTTASLSKKELKRELERLRAEHKGVKKARKRAKKVEDKAEKKRLRKQLDGLEKTIGKLEKRLK